MPRMLFRLKTLAAPGAILAFALAAPPAGAAVGVSSFSLAPSTTQAGANPDIATDVRLSPSGGDDVREVRISLAAGLLANPTAAPPCSTAALQSDSCPAGSQVGSGTVTGATTVVSFDAPAKVYLVQPGSGEAARLGVVATTPVGRIVTSGPVTVRTTPDVGADVQFANLPRQVGGVDVTITRLQLTLNGSVGGNAFTRNPTSCSPATTRLQVVSYDAPSSSASSQSSFTPSGCASLPFAPGLTASAALDSYADGVELTSTTTQASGESAARQAALKLPSGLTTRSSTLSRACPAADPASCPTSADVGTATVSTPFLAAPLSGRLVLVSRGGQLPGLAIVLPSPYPLRLEGTTTSASDGLTITFGRLPDLPLRDVGVRLDGGQTSLLRRGWTLCHGSPTLNGDFGSHSGRTTQASARIAVTGCPFSD